MLPPPGTPVVVDQHALQQLGGYHAAVALPQAPQIVSQSLAQPPKSTSQKVGAHEEEKGF